MSAKRIPAPREVGSEPKTNLAAMFAPRTIAVIGATDSLGSVGRALMENLLPFSGEVFPVNPKHANLFGRKAFPTIADVPDEIDLAVIATPAKSVPQVVRDCAAAEVKGAIVISAGFKEIELILGRSSVLVADAWQGLGLGTEMLRQLVRVGRAERVQRIIGHILAENRRMLEVSRNIGFDLQFNKEADEWLAAIDLGRESQ